MTTNVSNTEKDEQDAAIVVSAISEEPAADAPEATEGAVKPKTGKPVIKPDNWTNG